MDSTFYWYKGIWSEGAVIIYDRVGGWRENNEEHKKRWHNRF